jgi:hypothetical protein
MMRTATLCLLLALTTACGSAPKKVTITPAGQQVQLDMRAPERCAVIGDVYGKFESTDQEQALRGAKIDIRNRAALLGADHVVLETNNGSTRIDAWSGTVINTHYQMLLGGKALKCGPQAPPASTTATSPVLSL